MKKCTSCKEIKDEIQFCSNVSRKDGLNSECRDCKKFRSNKYKSKYPERVKESNRKYRENNLEKIKIVQKEYTKKHRDYLLEKKKGHYQSKREHYLETMKVYREQHQDDITEKQKEYRIKNRNKLQLKAYKQNSAKRNYAWKLTDEQAIYIMSLPCYYCGEQGGGIDRYINSIGYNLENCVPCCWRCNISKNKMNGDEYILHIQKVLAYQKSKEKTNLILI